MCLVQMFMYFITPVSCASTYYLYQDNITESVDCQQATPCSSIDLFEDLVHDDTSAVTYDSPVTLYVKDYAELNGFADIDPSPGGDLDITFEGDGGVGVLQGGGTITFHSDENHEIDVLFLYMKIWSYHVVEDAWHTSIIACVDHTNVEFRHSIIADFASQIDFPLPDHYSLVCVWDGQVAAVRIANTKCKITNTTFDGICLGGLSLRNTLPWDEPAEGDPRILLELDKFMFRGNHWPQPTLDGVRAYVPNRNLFVLSESTTTDHVILHAGDADFDGGADLTGATEIYIRGAILLTDVAEPGTYVTLTPIQTTPSFDDIQFSVRMGATRESTIVTLKVTGSNFFRCGSNAFTISPYFNDEAPLNPSWRTIPIVKETGMEEIVAEAKSSDLWPAGTWVVRATIAAVNYVKLDVQGVGSYSRSDC
ncbi:hypothetical protein BLNAU_16104 [Blattamonas nauphoetae]|uniref:Uncharacterized protein n=1 Tax=Blattamonas nauphoetae TaxID=2049346 RepID=A0ABQ9X8S7_9EUKA|nr:hypothetical protein BLNAU_16104 [Blattamonas nauphoetae]